MPAEETRPVSIRPARPEDAERLAAMRRELQEHMRYINPAVPALAGGQEQALAGELRGLAGDRTACLLVAEGGRDAAAPAGMALGRLRAATGGVAGGDIEYLWVPLNARGQGVMGALLAGLASFFRARGVAYVTASYVDGCGQTAGAWQRYGFDPLTVTAGVDIEELEESIARR